MQSVFILCSLDENCEYGKYSRLIIKPKNVKYTPSVKMITKIKNKFGFKKKEKKSEDTSKSDGEEDQQKDIEFWEIVDQRDIPVIACVNSKSGDYLGESILSSFYKYLNPIQVIDLQNEGTKRLQILLAALPKAKIIVAGGDGTLHWVINDMIKNKQMELDDRILMLMPLGTGNDLSRHTGWGETTVVENTTEYFDKCLLPNESIPLVLVDRWRVQIKRPINKLKFIKKKMITNFFTNYFGIGIDAAVVCEFDRIRKKFPTFCSSPVLV